MRDLDQALADIGTIRQQIARQEGFRGYGPTAIALTGLLAAAVSTGQWISAGTAASPTTYFAIWIATAVLSVVVVGIEAVTRSRRQRSRLGDAMILAAASDFAPAGAAGVALLIVFARYEPGSLWMLPGLWQIILALGFFAASRSLPRALMIVGGWYLGAGFVTLAFSASTHELSPWAMGIPFSLGQLAAAYVLGRSLEAVDAV